MRRLRRRSSDDLNRDARRRGAVHRVGNTEIITPDRDVLDARLEYERLEREIARSEEKPLTRPACWKHPEWIPAARSAQQPHPPQSFCPHCREEADHAERKPAASEALALQSQSEGLIHRDRDWEARWRQAKPNEPVPGSSEERTAVEEMDARRDRVLRAERKRAERLRRFSKTEPISDYDGLWAR
jgi:hypothetical protein